MGDAPLAGYYDVNNDNFFMIKEIEQSCSGLLISLSKHADDQCDIIWLKLPEKESGNDTKNFDDQLIAIVVKLPEHNCITPTTHINFLTCNNLTWIINLLQKSFMDRPNAKCY